MLGCLVLQNATLGPFQTYSKSSPAARTMTPITRRPQSTLIQRDLDESAVFVQDILENWSVYQMCNSFLEEAPLHLGWVLALNACKHAHYSSAKGRHKTMQTKPSKYKRYFLALLRDLNVDFNVFDCDLKSLLESLRALPAHETTPVIGTTTSVPTHEHGTPLQSSLENTSMAAVIYRYSSDILICLGH